jgi:hypothetical protein
MSKFWVVIGVNLYLSPVSKCLFTELPKRLPLPRILWQLGWSCRLPSSAVISARARVFTVPFVPTRNIIVRIRKERKGRFSFTRRAYLLPSVRLLLTYSLRLAPVVSRADLFPVIFRFPPFLFFMFVSSLKNILPLFSVSEAHDSPPPPQRICFYVLFDLSKG